MRFHYLVAINQVCADLGPRSPSSSSSQGQLLEHGEKVDIESLGNGIQMVPELGWFDLMIFQLQDVMKVLSSQYYYFRF